MFTKIGGFASILRFLNFGEVVYQVFMRKWPVAGARVLTHSVLKIFSIQRAALFESTRTAGKEANPLFSFRPLLPRSRHILTIYMYLPGCLAKFPMG